MKNAISALFTLLAFTLACGCATDPADPAGPDAGNGSGSDGQLPADGQVYMSQQGQFAVVIPQGYTFAEVNDPYCMLKLVVTGDGTTMDGTFVVCYGQSGQGSTPDTRFDLALGTSSADCGASMNHDPCIAVTASNPTAAGDTLPNEYTAAGNIHYEQRFYGISIHLKDPSQTELYPLMVAKLRLLN